jgi:uncharacterized protein
MFKSLAFICLATAGIVTAPAATLPEPRGANLLEPFNYAGVRLDPGPLAAQVQEVKQAYLGFSDDGYLLGFRRRAGLPAPGTEFGGWYAADRFIPFGQVLSGLARMYAGTGDEACRAKLNRLVAGWAQCIEADGYFFYSRKPNATYYGYEKMVCGLVDAYVFAGNREALAHLARITDWAEKHLDRSRPYAFNGPGDPGEWYTLSENLYRAFLATGDSRYRDFARVWEYTEFWRYIKDGTEFYSRAPHHHAYSHINSLSGAALAYRVTGERSYLDTLIRGYDYLQQHEVFATGGYGPAEHLLPAQDLSASLDNLPNENHFETQCASWASFKLAKALISFTGEARYGDWIERLVINATGASLPVSPKGEATYYSHYTLSGAAKNYSSGPWTCCSGTRIQAVADYHDLIYFKTAAALHVNLFTPSTCEWQVGATPVTVRQQTDFPASERVRLTLSTAREVAFAVKLRNPAWLAAPMRVTVNGQPTSATVDARGWVELARTWRDGDEVGIVLPMALRATVFPPDASTDFPAALIYGPTVLAVEAKGANPVGAIDWKRLSASLMPLPGEPLSFRLAGQPDAKVRPLYAFARDEPYYVYFDPARPWSRLPPKSIRFSDDWKETPAGLKVARTPGAWVEATFRGTGIRWVGRKYDDAGIGKVLLDGAPAGRVDLYAPNRNGGFQHDLLNLAAGEHVIRIVVAEEKNAESRERFVNVARFEVIGGAAASGERP